MAQVKMYSKKDKTDTTYVITEIKQKSNRNQIVINSYK